ncbi:hypothetical protein Tco_0348544 [Tanacetum coccineum]
MTAVATMEYQLGGALEWRLPADNETEDLRFGERKSQNLDDIVVLTRGNVIRHEVGLTSLEFSAEFHGLLKMGPTQSRQFGFQLGT